MRFRRRRPNPERLLEQLEHCSHCGATVEAYVRTCLTCGASLVEEKTATLRALRDRGAMSDAAFDVAVGLLEEDEQPRQATVDACHIRKQVSELLVSDLREFPIWEFAIDEEGVHGQDEETVRPRPDLTHVDPHDGIFIVRARFTAADGTSFDGFVSPHEERHIGFLQPTIITGNGQVRFWFGIVPPKPGVVEAQYRALEKPAEALFPLDYRALVGCASDEPAGTIDGFMHYEPGSRSRIVSLR